MPRRVSDRTLAHGQQGSSLESSASTQQRRITTRERAGRAPQGQGGHQQRRRNGEEPRRQGGARALWDGWWEGQASKPHCRNCQNPWLGRRCLRPTSASHAVAVTITDVIWMKDQKRQIQTHCRQCRGALHLHGRKGESASCRVLGAKRGPCFARTLGVDGWEPYLCEETQKTLIW